MNYDYLIVGSGLFGATFAHLARKKGKRCLVIDKRPHTGGNIWCESVEGIHVHRYGAHIFHTSDKAVWDYMGKFTEFNRYTNSPIARYKDEQYNLPFNMNTFHQMWGVKTPEEAKAKIEEQKKEAGITEPSLYSVLADCFWFTAAAPAGRGQASPAVKKETARSPAAVIFQFFIGVTSVFFKLIKKCKRVCFTDVIQKRFINVKIFKRK